MKKIFENPTWTKLKWPVAALGLVLLFNFIFTSGFFQLEIKNGRVYGSLVDIFNRATPVMLLSLGMTLVIATAGVDLSVGAVMAIAGSIAASLLTNPFRILPAFIASPLEASQSVPAVIAIALAASLLLGLWNGFLVGFFKVPPIVATLILMVSGRGIAQLLTNGQIITFENKSFEFLARGVWFRLPITISITAIVFLLLLFFTKKTAAGLFIESTGDNETACRYAGVNTQMVKLIAYAVCSLLAGLAGLIVTADIKAADANNAGLYLELDAILATVIGGTALTGGRFFLAGSLIGAILIQTLTTTILTRGVAVEWTLVVKAVVIIIVCLLQSESFRKIIWRRQIAA
ncbi:MAG: ABC transporter permease [Verrucomicrobiota bacterium]|nr:ABC transporter permease [Verrucomicrobiota bacterium]